MNPSKFETRLYLCSVGILYSAIAEPSMDIIRMSVSADVHENERDKGNF